MTAKAAITTTELTAATNAPEDVASHEDDALHTQRLQAIHQFRDYSTQDYNVAVTYTGPLPCSASGGLEVSRTMGTSTQGRQTNHELETRA